jgi:hypothetical protein
VPKGETASYPNITVFLRTNSHPINIFSGENPRFAGKRNHARGWQKYQLFFDYRKKNIFICRFF